MTGILIGLRLACSRRRIADCFAVLTSLVLCGCAVMMECAVRRAGRLGAFLNLRHGLLAQAVNRRFRPPDELGASLASPLATRARPIAAKPRPSSAWQGAAKLAAR